MVADPGGHSGQTSDVTMAIIEQVIREMDFEHLKRLARYSPEERLEAMFQMIEFIHDVSAAGRLDREQQA
ncbi:hypothetical protein [Aggregatilinea lenta]|uniref:hypothetical protein n=1 Tax=Aggregatilinea lenta TaxID=913108 RepID=UPI000E5B91AA|nr:hypothetical protein [Aggregatilinea lenta]